MLSNFVSKNRYLVKLIVMTLIGLVMLFDFITLFGSYSNQTGANAGVSFSFLASAALLGLLLFCMLSNKEDYAKMLGVLYLAYYVISILLSVGNNLLLTNASKSSPVIAVPFPSSTAQFRQRHSSGIIDS